jgi:hypothetical protein
VQRTVGLAAAVALADFHRATTDAADAEVSVARDGAAGAGDRAVHGSEACLGV